MPKPRKETHQPCTCRCNRHLSRWTIWRHLSALSSGVVQPESLPPPKRRRTIQFQVDAGSSSSRPPQLHIHSSESNPDLPFLDPPVASELPQIQGDAHDNASSRLVDSFLLNLHARTHRTTVESDNEDSEDACEGDTVEATDFIDPETDDFWDGEGVECDVDAREGTVPDWDLLAEELIVEAEELGTSKHSSSHTPRLTTLLCSGEFSILEHDFDILRPFAMKIRNNLAASTFNEMSYNFSKAGIENLANT